MPLGDFIETALSKIGITEERVSRWLGRPCGCRERRDKLNQLFYWASRTSYLGKQQSEDELSVMLNNSPD